MIVRSSTWTFVCSLRVSCVASRAAPKNFAACFQRLPRQHVAATTLAILQQSTKIRRPFARRMFATALNAARRLRQLLARPQRCQRAKITSAQTSGLSVRLLQHVECMGAPTSCVACNQQQLLAQRRRRPPARTSIVRLAIQSRRMPTKLLAATMGANQLHAVNQTARATNARSHCGTRFQSLRILFARRVSAPTRSAACVSRQLRPQRQLQRPAKTISARQIRLSCRNRFAVQKVAMTRLAAS